MESWLDTAARLVLRRVVPIALAAVVTALVALELVPGELAACLGAAARVP